MATSSIFVLCKFSSLENLYSSAFYHPDRWAPQHEDELIKTGLYQLKGNQTTLKSNFTGSQAFIMVMNSSTFYDDWIAQIAISYYTQYSMAIRTRTGDTKKWTPWRYLNAS